MSTQSKTKPAATKPTKRAPRKTKQQGIAQRNMLIGFGVIGTAFAALGAGLYKLTTL